MNNIYVLSESDTIKLLEMEEVIEAVENVYREKTLGSGKLFPMVFHEFESQVADMDIKSGTLDDMGVYGLKLVSWFGENRKKNLPMLSGVVMLFDRETGIPLALINAEHMTGMRTGAAGAIGARYLARRDSQVMLMVGAGHQATYQIRAMQTVFPALKKVMVFDPVNMDNASVFVDNFGYKKENTQYIAVENIEAAAGEADIIVTATPSRKPMIMKEWVKPGTHFSCMGSDMEGKQEIDPEILASARLVADDINQSVNVGEFEKGIKEGIIAKTDIICEIGDVISGREEGRESEADITVFDSTGLGLQDIAVGYMAVKKAGLMDDIKKMNF